MSKNTYLRLVYLKCQPLYQLDSFAERAEPEQVGFVDPFLRRNDLQRLMFVRSEPPAKFSFETPSKSSVAGRTGES